ncbi:STAS domain-containing protein [Emcibacter nanhaiensis]|uniref:STAS domain-containing protein n=1 Tax=Emcibacter nanhaiensis TaxID=1505037 RepID=UPI0015E35F8E|nr:STAS domain-containing protein [Emcibacter nanhaiensis]
MSVRKEAIVTIEGTLGVKDSKDIGQRLYEALDKHECVTIDVHEQAECSIGIVQIIISAQRTARHLGRELRLADTPSPAFKTILIRAGLLSPDGGARTEEEQFWVSSAAELDRELDGVTS